MTHYMLDTNILTAIAKDAKGRAAGMFARLEPDEVGISIVVASEVRFGLAKNGAARSSRTMTALVDNIRVLPFESPADRIYGQLRADLTRRGSSLSPNDYLIVAHAMTLDAILVTDDRAILDAPVSGLKTENWLR